MYRFSKKELFQNSRLEAKLMKKQLHIFGITLLLLTIGLSGCTDNNLSSKSNEEKIIGKWKATFPNTNVTPISNFYINGSFLVTIAGQTAWATYAMTDDTLAFSVQGSSETTTLEYTFSNNDNRLTCIEVDGDGEYALLTRI
jgi:hypothetical protein